MSIVAQLRNVKNSAQCNIDAHNVEMEFLIKNDRSYVQIVGTRSAKSVNSSEP